MLLFSAGRFDRLAVPLSLVARLEEIPSANVEHAAGRMVVQYRGQILPLVSLAGQLDPGADTSCRRARTYRWLCSAMATGSLGWWSTRF